VAKRAAVPAICSQAYFRIYCEKYGIICNLSNLYDSFMMAWQGLTKRNKIVFCQQRAEKRKRKRKQ
jgi:hypothetical protein